MSTDDDQLTSDDCVDDEDDENDDENDDADYNRNDDGRCRDFDYNARGRHYEFYTVDKSTNKSGNKSSFRDVASTEERMSSTNLYKSFYDNNTSRKCNCRIRLELNIVV